MVKLHSPIGPSAASRWSICTWSVNKVADLRNRGIIGQSESSPHASEGTLAHTRAERVLLGESEPLCDDLQFYVDHCKEIGPDYEIEMSVPLWYDKPEVGDTYWLVDDTIHRIKPLSECEERTFTQEELNNYERMCGTVDYVNQVADTLYIRDLKYGFMPVKSVNNLQLAIYARSIAENCDLPDTTTVNIAIVQPRVEHKVTEWVLSLAELIAFTDPISDIAARISRHEGLQFFPSEDTCRFCDAKAHCAARLGPVYEEVRGITEDQKLDDDAQFSIWSRRKEIAAVIKDIEADYMNRALAGDVPEGTKLIVGRRKAKVWKNKEEAQEKLLQVLPIDKVLKTTVISPTQAAKLTDVDPDLIFQGEGGPSLVTIETKGKPYINDEW